MLKGSREMECGPRCRSRQHILQLLNTVTKGSTKQIKAHLSKCYCGFTNSDQTGRTVLHIAVSCGKWQIVNWLLNEKNVEFGGRDLESGWTALHRALFYGQILCARQLIDCGANLYIRDKEGLTPLDLIMKDRLPHVEYSTNGPSEVHTWGDNLNFTLGHESQQRRKFPESVELFRKQMLSIKQVCMSKYHSVFLDQHGSVYTCGHGHGGRLGHPDENTCLVPRKVDALKQEECVVVAAARDHTVFLTEGGVVYTCGLNNHQQLGQQQLNTKCIVPKQVSPKTMKGKKIKGICANRFHTIVFTDQAVFSFGLNAGQLGHMKVAGERYITQPRMVTALNHKDIVIKHVAASDAATAVITGKGDVFVLHEYRCRRIASKLLDITQVVVTGGQLDFQIDTDRLQEKGGNELLILLKNSTGKVYIWRAEEPVLKRCCWVIKRAISVADIALSVNSINFVTSEGEAFKADVPKSKPAPKEHTHKESVASSPPTSTFNLTLSDLVDREEIEDIRVERIPHIHRALSITADRKGRNFAVLQGLPKESLTDIPTVDSTEMGDAFLDLLEEADEMDLIHDVMIKVGNTLIPAHKYVLISRNEFFKKAFSSNSSEGNVTEKTVIDVGNVNIDIFKQLVKFIYTDDCDLLKNGSPFKFTPSQGETPTPHVDTIDIIEDIEFSKPVSAFQVHEKKKKKKKGKSLNPKSREEESKETSDPVKLLQEMAKKFVALALVKRLDSVKFSKGLVSFVSGRTVGNPKLKFDRTKHSDLYDVCIRSQDGVDFQCHKCVLVARLEYFHSMLATGWIETSKADALSLPIPSDILEVVLDYLYTDSAPSVRDGVDAELVCNILVVADQLLITRLKQICETAAVNLMSMKNVCELLQFASVYNAKQLKGACQQFITINLAALIESRALDVINDDVMEDFTSYYRNAVAAMSYRMITPYSDWPDYDYLEEIESEYTEDDDSISKTVESVRKLKGRKRRSRTKSSGDSDSKVSPGVPRPERTISVSSDTQFPLELDELLESSESADSPMQSPRGSSRVTLPLKITPGSTVVHGLPSPGSPASSISPVAAPGPTSPSQAIGLRAIMEQEAESARPKHVNTATSSLQKKSGKLTQKERKKLLIAQQEESKQPSVTNPSAGAKTKAWTKPTNPWGTINKVVKPFQELMMDEEETLEKDGSVQMVKSPPSLGATGGAKPKPSGAAGKLGGQAGDMISWGLPSSRTQTRRQSESEGATSPSSPRENPWVNTTIPRNVSFSDIIKDETEQKKILQRNINKPLALIQLEEQAIEDLLELYNAENTEDEHITVERVPVVMALPTWAATKKK